MSREDGGPAFPCYRPEGPKMMDGYPEHEAAMIPGMTLRDYFAAKVIQGISSVTGVDFGGPDEAARIAYKIADAMLSARKEKTR